MWKLLIAIVLAYLAGSIPFSYLIPKLLKKIDIKTVGSGNVGATNVFRVCGIYYGLAAFLCDGAKAGVSFLIAQLFFSPEEALLVGISAVIGHSYSIFLKFGGGKGVASSAGLILCYDPLLFLALLGIFVFMFLITSYVSLASITAAFLTPVTYYSLLQGEKKTALLLIFLGAFVIFRHRSNIKRLMRREESKIKVFKR